VTRVEAMNEASARPGALDREVHHPIGTLSGRGLLALRVTENVVHGWDLATAIGVEVPISGEAVEMAYHLLAPVAASLSGNGFFAAPSSALAPDATRLEQLLHLVGR
jgi:uncharacterized protein (TIGR03086 family)